MRNSMYERRGAKKNLLSVVVRLVGRKPTYFKTAHQAILNPFSTRSVLFKPFARFRNSVVIIHLSNHVQQG